MLDFAAIGIRAAAAREVAWGIASPSGGGERLDLAWRFWPDRPRYALALTAPFSIGTIGVEGIVEHQPFTGGVPESHRATARISVAQWSTGRLKWDARAGLDRWNTIGHAGAVG